MMPSNRCRPLSFYLQSFPASGSFPRSWFFASSGQSIGASASVLIVNIQGWFPLGLTGLIYLLSKGLSRVFSTNTVQKHQFCGSQPFIGPTPTSIRDYWNEQYEKASLWCLKITSLACGEGVTSLPERLNFNLCWVRKGWQKPWTLSLERCTKTGRHTLSSGFMGSLILESQGLTSPISRLLKQGPPILAKP